MSKYNQSNIQEIAKIIKSKIKEIKLVRNIHTEQIKCFSGSSDECITDFFEDFEILSTLLYWNENDMFQQLPFYLDGFALENFKEIKNLHQYNYKQLKEHLIKQFNSIEQKHISLSQLRSIKQNKNESVNDYAATIMRISRKLFGTLNDSDLDIYITDKFINGLLPYIKEEMLHREIHNFNNSVKQARMIECYSDYYKKEYQILHSRGELVSTLHSKSSNANNQYFYQKHFKQNYKYQIMNKQENINKRSNQTTNLHQHGYKSNDYYTSNLSNYSNRKNIYNNPQNITFSNNNYNDQQCSRERYPKLFDKYSVESNRTNAQCENFTNNFYNSNHHKTDEYTINFDKQQENNSSISDYIISYDCTQNESIKSKYDSDNNNNCENKSIEENIENKTNEENIENITYEESMINQEPDKNKTIDQIIQNKVPNSFKDISQKTLIYENMLDDNEQAIILKPSKISDKITEIQNVDHYVQQSIDQFKSFFQEYIIKSYVNFNLLKYSFDTFNRACTVSVIYKFIVFCVIYTSFLNQLFTVIKYIIFQRKMRLFSILVMANKYVNLTIQDNIKSEQCEEKIYQNNSSENLTYRIRNSRKRNLNTKADSIMVNTHNISDNLEILIQTFFKYSKDQKNYFTINFCNKFKNSIYSQVKNNFFKEIETTLVLWTAFKGGGQIYFT